MKNFIQHPNMKVVITFDNNETLARVYENNKEVVRAVAHCAPEDEFDVVLGVDLALSRAMDYLKHEKPYIAWKVVNRKPKPGDYVRIKSTWFNFDKDHPVAKKMYKYDEDVSDDYLWHYSFSGVEVVEPVDKDVEIINDELYRKVNRKAKAGDYMRVIKSVYPCETYGKIYKIHSADDYTIYVRHSDHPDHMELFKGDRWPKFNHLWPHNINYDGNEFEILEKL